MMVQLATDAHLSEEMHSVNGHCPLQFTTARLLLREWAMADLPVFHAIAADPEVMRYITGKPTTLEESQTLLQQAITRNHSRPRQGYGMAIVLRDEVSLAAARERQHDRLIGRCSLIIDSKEPCSAALGYHLARADWGQGYATEAARTLVEFAFTRLGLHRLYAECRPENVASVRVMEKLGMRCEGILRGNRYLNGQWCDTLVCSILEEEWRSTTR